MHAHIEASVFDRIRCVQIKIRALAQKYKDTKAHARTQKYNELTVFDSDSYKRMYARTHLKGSKHLSHFCSKRQKMHPTLIF